MYEFMETNDQAVGEDEPLPLISEQDKRLSDQESYLFKSLQTFHEQDLFHDVKLCVNGNVIPAHKLVLVSYSGFFKSMFTCEMKESKESQIQLQESDFVNFRKIIHFMYTSEVELTDGNMEALLKMSVLYQISSLEKICQNYIIKCINKDNYVHFLDIADSLNCRNLLVHATKFILDNFVVLAKEPLFCSIPAKALIVLMSTTPLKVLTELQVYRAFRTWILHDKSRMQYFEKMLRHIRFVHIPYRHINIEIFGDMNTVFSEHSGVLQQKITECNRLWAMKSEKVLLNHEEMESLFRECYEGETARRDGWRRGNSIYIFGGINHQQEYSDTYECYDVEQNKWTHMGHMLSPRSASCAVYYQGSIVLAGGLDDLHRPSNTVDMLCVATGTWTQATPMLQARSVFGMKSLGGLIYAIGGHIGECYTTAVEILDPIKDKWTSASPLISRHGCFSAVALEGCLYCMGGFSRSNVYDYGDIVERYDPRVGKWSYAASLCSTRAAHQAVVIDNCIYVFGGTHKNGFKTDIECFDPRKNEWTSIAPSSGDLSSTCMGFGVFEDSIFITGGRNPSSREHEAIDTVIEYNVSENEWEYRDHMVEKRMFSASVTV